MYLQDSEDSYNRQLVPGTTAGSSSPGTIGPSYANPTPISYGSAAPQTQTPSIGGFGQQQTQKGSMGGLGQQQAQIPSMGGFGQQFQQQGSSQNAQQVISQFVGQKVKAIFVFEGGILRDFSGTLQGIGSNYILLQETDGDDFIMGDLYSLKVLQIYK